MAQQVFEIPLVATPQLFTVTLLNITYQFRVWWNDSSENWMIDIFDVNSNPLVQGIAMVTGVDLLGQYEYLGIGGQLIAQTDNQTDNVPTFDNLGTTGHLYFLPA